MKFLSFLLSVAIIPTLSFALTNGPVQQEYQNFEQGGANIENMVDPATGDFAYSIPLGESISMAVATE